MKNIVPFGSAVTCDVCEGDGSLCNEGEPTRVTCPQCAGFGEFRPTPKAVVGTVVELHETERPKVDYRRLAGQCDSVGDFLLVSSSHILAATDNVTDETILGHSAEVMLHLEKARKLIREMGERCDELKGRA